METRLEIELREKLISECLKWEIELKRLKRGWRAKKKKNLKVKRHNKLLENKLVVLRRQSLENRYKNVIEIKECEIVLRSDKIYQKNQLKTTEQQTINDEANQQAIFLKYQFECRHPGCVKKFTSKENLNVHMNCHTNKHQCQDCLRCFRSKSHLHVHSCRDIDEWSFECDWDGCGKRFKCESSLKYHVKKTHLNDKAFYCNQEDCGRFFKLKKSLEAHLQDHLVFRPFQCHLQGCGKRFKTKLHFTNHLKKHKRMLNDEELGTFEKLLLKVDDQRKVVAVNEFRVFIVDPKKNQDVGSNESIVYKCQHPGCEKKFKNKIKYNRHNNIHTTKYQCQHCQKCFTSLADLKIHLRIHTGEKPLKCDWDGCGKRFRTKPLLKMHLKTKHSEERPFKCPEDGCDKSFKAKRVLNQHLKYHSTESPFHCEMDGCEKKFKTRGDLKQHQRTHK